jgi:hypothetical protein
MSETERFILQLAVAVSYALSDVSDKAAEPVLTKARDLVRTIRAARGAASEEDA